MNCNDPSGDGGNNSSMLAMHLRTLLILGARSVLASATSKSKTDPLSRWAVSVQERRGYGKALVAIAAKNARMAWAVLAKGEAYAPLAAPTQPVTAQA